MSGLSLQHFQADFAAALVSGDPAARPEALGSEAADRFRIYRNNFYHGASQQLAEAYPVVRRFMGEAFFFAAAHAFLKVHAPRTRSLALFGREFPGFLGDFRRLRACLISRMWHGWSGPGWSLSTPPTRRHWRLLFWPGRVKRSPRPVSAPIRRRKS